jgi:hypothetical protein
VHEEEPDTSLDHRRIGDILSHARHLCSKDRVRFGYPRGIRITEEYLGKALESLKPPTPRRDGFHASADLGREIGEVVPKQTHHLVHICHVLRSLVPAICLLGDQDLLHDEEAGMGQAHLKCLGLLRDLWEPC